MKICSSFLATIMIAIVLSLFSQSNGVCQDNPAPTEDQKQEIRKAAVAHMQHIIDGNAKDFVSGYDENTVDLGGGPNGDGSIDLEAFEIQLEQDCNGAEFKSKFNNKNLSHYLQIDSALVYSYEDIMAGKHKKWERFGFKLQPNDYFIQIPPTPNSPLSDGFMAYYRKIRGVWKIAATD